MLPEIKILRVNKRYLPCSDHSRDLALTVVLVEGEIGDYAAYAGLGENLQFIAAFGYKISFKEATCHFPFGLKEENYRD